MVIVPNYVRDAIYEKIDEALKKWPDAEADREVFYNQLLQFYDEHGDIPHFDIEPKVDKRDITG